jgi:hypothetical protein
MKGVHGGTNPTPNGALRLEGRKAPASLKGKKAADGEGRKK